MTSRPSASGASGAAASGLALQRADPTAPATSSTLPACSESSSGVPVGATAGAVVGCAVVVGLLSFLLTWFFMNRRAKKQRAARATRFEDKGARETTASSSPLGSDAANLSKFLPASLDDETVQRAGFGLLDKLENHVDSFYRNTPSPVSTAAFETLAAVIPESQLARSSAVAATSKPKPALICCLAEIVAFYIFASGDPSNTLLPAVFPLFSSAVNSSHSDDAVYWSRMLATYLHPGAKEEPRFLSKRQETTAALVDAVSQAFSPWESGKYSQEDRVKGLTRIFQEASDFGILLYTQPSGFELHWSSGEQERLPSLLKVSNEKGEKLRKPQGLVEGVAVSA